MANLKNINTFDFNNDKIIIDTNILLLIFGPETFSTNKSSNVSNVFNKLLDNSKVELLVNQPVISEFINKSIRRYFNLFKDNNSLKDDYPYKGYYKNNSYIKGYRDEEDFKQKYELVLDNAKEIISLVNLIDTSKKATNKALNQEFRNLDLTDEQIIYDALENHAMIWTRDNDFLHATNNKLTILK